MYNLLVLSCIGHDIFTILYREKEWKFDNEVQKTYLCCKKDWQKNKN